MSPPRPPGARVRRALLWGLLVVLIAVAQSLLVWLTLQHEATRAQDAAEGVAADAAGAMRSESLRLVQALQVLSWRLPGPAEPADLAALATDPLRERPEVRRLEWRDGKLAVRAHVDSPFPPAAFALIPRRELTVEADAACSAARRTGAPRASRSYFAPVPGGLGVELVDLCVPVLRDGADAGFLVASVSLAGLLERSLAGVDHARHEVSLVEPDGSRLARAGRIRGANVYVAHQLVDLPGLTLRLRADSAAGRPSLIPNLATALVLTLSIALFALVIVLARDVRRRAEAEAALADAFWFRKAMEDSLSTGLRARDMRGVVTYANPAFCEMTGFSLDELRAHSSAERAPYWPPEHAGEYATRQGPRLAGAQRSAAEAREGYETTFMRRNGERFPVRIYEAPLLDRQGRQAGWMSAVVDLSAQRRVEELSRQQADRLNATARLATVGEMASLLSHELNQPLAAIASYATGSINLLEGPDAAPPSMLRQALEKIAEQAERAGRVIKSVHDFVRRREQPRESMPAAVLLEAVLPLVRLQARKSGTRIEVDGPAAADGPVRVLADRTMVEQVLLNLTRNGIQAMETEATPLAERVLTIRMRRTHERWVRFEVIDRGPGIPPEVAQRLFTPFFTTRAEGMGLGLSLCRTVIEQHGGALDFGPGPGGRGTEFRFTLPAPRTVPGNAATAADGPGAPEESPDPPAPGASAESGDTVAGADRAATG